MVEELQQVRVERVERDFGETAVVGETTEHDCKIVVDDHLQVHAAIGQSRVRARISNLSADRSLFSPWLYKEVHSPVPPRSTETTNRMEGSAAYPRATLEQSLHKLTISHLTNLQTPSCRAPGGGPVTEPQTLSTWASYEIPAGFQLPAVCSGTQPHPRLPELCKSSHSKVVLRQNQPQGGAKHRAWAATRVVHNHTFRDLSPCPVFCTHSSAHRLSNSQSVHRRTCRECRDDNTVGDILALSFPQICNLE